MIADLVLSSFPGIDLLGRGFEQAGYCVVRGPDLLCGQRVEDFHSLPGAFEGVIAGTPCQDYSRARRADRSGRGDSAIAEFVRVVTEAYPLWWLLENVHGSPRVSIPEYEVQRIETSAREFGGAQHRLRVFQFGSRDGTSIVLTRSVTNKRQRDTRKVDYRCCMASEGNRADRRAWPDFCELQGLPRDFELPGWSLRAKYRAVGNGVPVFLARDFAIAIRSRRVTGSVKTCLCGCGRPVEGKATMGGVACRKRMQRRRDSAGVTLPGPVTPAESRP